MYRRVVTAGFAAVIAASCSQEQGGGYREETGQEASQADSVVETDGSVTDES